MICGHLCNHQASACRLKAIVIRGCNSCFLLVSILKDSANITKSAENANCVQHRQHKLKVLLSHSCVRLAKHWATKKKAPYTGAACLMSVDQPMGSGLDMLSTRPRAAKFIFDCMHQNLALKFCSQSKQAKPELVQTTMMLMAGRADAIRPKSCNPIVSESDASPLSAHCPIWSRKAAHGIPLPIQYHIKHHNQCIDWSVCARMSD